MRGGFHATPSLLENLALAVVMVGVGLVVAAGGVGDDFRGLGVLALSELAVTRGLRLPGWLAGRPLARAALRLAVAAMAVAAVGASMPSAQFVAGLFLLEGVMWLGWVGLLWRGGGNRLRLRAHLEMAALVTGVGVWFVSIPAPPSGWSPVVGVLLGGAVVTSANRLDAAPVEEER
jgi:hypothetical protein